MPPQKTLPFPVMITAFIEGSYFTTRAASSKANHIVPSKAFALSGRFKVMVATASHNVKTIKSSFRMGFNSFNCGPAQ
jgi:hypothetical protein